jgi:hypothetical protein
VVHGASCVTGIDLHITLTPVSSQEPLQLDRAGGQRRPQGVIGLEGGEFHRNGTPLALTIDLAEASSTKRLRCQLSRFDFGGQLA